ncbi:hypothetical protein, partial [Neisseria meningitidis]|uniref:hypothetical protein n=1 Tax=Neisseria meningitidis TaxID=487 RepID=UPI001E4225F4
GGGFQPFPVFRAKARTTVNDRKPNPDKLLKIERKTATVCCDNYRKIRANRIYIIERLIKL